MKLALLGATFILWTALNMCKEINDLQTALIFFLNLKKTAAESYGMFIEAYGKYVCPKSQCFE